MGIARKGSRRIVVDDVAYRWSVSEQITHDNELMIAISPEGQTGATLLVRACGTRLPGSAFRYSHPAATPGKIADVIRLASASGWHASAPGKPFELRLDANF
jgi:hypothetical protein